jgi:Raf kinase inhibitor-like YbhB/YbcL family protein
MEEHKPGELPFVKWLVFNIPADSKGLPAALPQAEAFEGGIKQGRNDHGGTGYTGPCIPKGVMNYKLRLFALDTELDVPPTAKFENMIPVMNGHIVDAVDVDFFHYFKQ